MAGIGIKLNKFFDKGTVTGYLAGSGYSVVTTIAPMLLVIADILAMQKILGYSDAAYGSRQLFQATMLYIFVFALLASAFRVGTACYLVQCDCPCDCDRTVP